MCFMKKEYSIGDELCDMHDSFRFLPENLEVVGCVRLAAENNKELMAMFSKKLHNKSLFVVGYTPSGINLVAAWYYDMNTFGMCELKYKKS
jgi:hypothetical protein